MSQTDRLVRSAGRPDLSIRSSKRFRVRLPWRARRVRRPKPHDRSRYPGGQWSRLERSLRRTTNWAASLCGRTWWGPVGAGRTPDRRRSRDDRMPRRPRPFDGRDHSGSSDCDGFVGGGNRWRRRAERSRASRGPAAGKRRASERHHARPGDVAACPTLLLVDCDGSGELQYLRLLYGVNAPGIESATSNATGTAATSTSHVGH